MNRGNLGWSAINVHNITVMLCGGWTLYSAQGNRTICRFYSCFILLQRLMLAAVSNESTNSHRKMPELIKDCSHTNHGVSNLQPLREVFICFVKFPQLRVTKSDDIVVCRSMWGWCSLESEATKWFGGHVRSQRPAGCAPLIYCVGLFRLMWCCM